MDYLYGKLNKLVEAQNYNFASSDGTVSVSSNSNGQKEVDLSVNTQYIVTLKQIK